MRIGIDLTTTVTKQGTEVFALELLRASIKVMQGHEWVVYTSASFVSVEVSQFSQGHDRVSVVRLSSPTSSFGRAWMQQWKLFWLARRDKIEFLFSPSPFFCWFASCKKVVTIHDCAYAKFSEYRSFASRLYIQANIFLAKLLGIKVYTVSNFSATELKAIYSFSEKNIVHISEGVPLMPTQNLPEFSEISNIYSIKIPYFVYLGINRPRKNLIRLLKAFAIVLDEFPNCQLVFVGTVDNTFLNILEQAQQLSLDHAVIQTGFVDDSAKRVIISSATALVLPSLYEGFGLPILEAQSLGVPVVCSNTSSLPEIAGEGALYCDPMSIDSIASTMRIALLNSSETQRVIKFGFTNSASYSWDLVSKKWLDTLPRLS